MADLNDIQLRIVVQGTGLDNLNRLNDTLAKATGNIKNSGAAADTAKSKWSQFGDALNELERKFDAVFRAASHLQALGRDLSEIGQAGIGFLKESVDAWGEYEFAVHRAAGSLGIFDTTSPIFKRLQEEIDATAQEARLFPAEEIAKAVYIWGSATGQTVTNNEELHTVMKGLLPIMQTAAITETDYEKAIKGTYQIVQQYNLGLTRMADKQDVAAGRAKYVGEEISNVRDITEKLMMITQNTSLEYSDLIEAFRYTGSIAPALGVKYEDLAVILGRLGDLGIRGSQAGRALQQTFTKLLDPTVRASKALDEAWQNTYGLNKTFESMVFPNGEFIGLTEYIDQLAEVTEDMTQKERGNLLAIMTTQNELRTMVPLIEDQIAARKSGISVYDQEKYSLEGAAAQFEKTMHLLEISWQGTMGYLSNTIGPVVRAVGSEVANLARPFVEQIGLILQQIRAWMDTHPEIVQWIVQIIAVGSAIAVVGGAVFTAIGVLLAFGAGIAFVVKGLGSFMGIWTRFFPIAGAVIAVITAIATNFGGLRDAAERVIEGIVHVWEAMDRGSASESINVLQRLGEAILPALEVVARLVASALNWIADRLEDIADSPEAIKVVEGIASALGLFMAAGFVTRISGIAYSILTLGSNAFGATPYVKMLGEQMSKFFSISSLWPPNLIRNFKELNAAISMTGSDSKKKLVSAKDTIVNAVKSIGPAAVSAGSSLKGAMTGMAAAVKVASTGISLSIKSVLIASGIGIIIAAVALLVEAWVNNWGDIQGKFAAVVNWVSARLGEFGDWISGVWNTISGTISTAVTNIVNFFRDLPTKIGTFFSQVWTNVSNWVTQIVNTIIAFPGVVWQGIVDGFNNIMTFLTEWWTGLGENTGERVGHIVGVIIALPVLALVKLIEGFVAIWEWFVEWWENLTESIGNWVKGVVTTIVDWISKLPGHIADWFGKVLANLTQWWNSTIASVSKWVSTMVTNIIDWIAKLPGRIMDWLVVVWGNVSTWFGNLISSVATWAASVVNTIIDWISKLPGRFYDWLTSTINSVRNWFLNELIPKGGEWALDAVDNIIKFFKELPGKVVDAVGGVINKLARFFRLLPGKIMDAILSVGKGIIDGVWRGIQNAWQMLWDNVMGFFKGIVNGVMDTLNMHSPSKVFAEIGENMIAGVAVGINKNRSAVDAMQDQVDTLIDSAKALKTEQSALSGDFSYSADGEKKLVIEMRVTSPDGTVNKASRDQIEEIFTAEELVSALEHMATVA